MIRTRQGVLTVPSSVGVTNYDIGCPPVAVLFNSVDVLTADTASGNIGYGWGVGVSSTQQFLQSGYNQDNTNAFVFASSRIFSDRCIGAAGESPAWLAAYNGTYTDGFQLDWKAVIGQTGKRFAYLAFIDDEDNLVANAGVKNLAFSTTGNVAYTGVGFQPEFAMFGAIHNLNQEGQQQTFESVGITTGPSNQACVYNLNFSGGGSYDMGRTGMVMTPAGNGDISLTSFDADGFTLNYGQAYGWSPPANYGIFGYFALANLGGVKFGTGTQPNADGTQAFTGAGFEPGAMVAISPGQAFNNSFTNPSRRTIGFASKAEGGGTNQDSCWYGGGDVSPTNNAREEDDSQLLFMSSDFSAGGSYDAIAAVNSWDADGFTLLWDVNDTTDRDFAYVAFEAVAFPPCEGEEFVPQIYRYVLY